jgi:hypothetical protein
MGELRGVAGVLCPQADSLKAVGFGLLCHASVDLGFALFYDLVVLGWSMEFVTHESWSFGVVCERA